MTRNDLRSPEVLTEIGKLRSSGMSFNGIAKEISRTFNLKEPTVLAVQKAYNIYSSRSSEVIAGDDELKKGIKEAVLDTKDQLVKINSIVWEIIQSAETPKDKLGAAKEILNHLRFQQQLITKITEGFDFKNMNRIEVTKIVVNNLEQLEKDGFIKILNKPGQIIDLEKVREAEFTEDETDRKTD